MTQNRRPNQQPKQTREKPAVEFLSWPFKVSVWERQKQTDGGRSYVERTTVVSKSFKRDRNADYEEQKMTVFAEELPKLIVVLIQASMNATVESRVPDR